MTKPKNAVSRPSHSENMKRLIAVLRNGQLNRYQAAEMMQVSPENAGKYLCELKREGIIAFTPDDGLSRGGYKRISYVLIANEQTVRSYLASLDAPVPAAVRQARLIAERVRREARAVTPPVQIAKVDPLALPPNFFKPSASPAAPADRLERAPAKPTGFAALATIRFQLDSEVCA
ncbi:hypothetical protein [Massilia pseudoviolaceinigra]|uniref:hypothetical protein n=1 Tax=Massilia pseudoviolaceinigra TaxID=3057165 RepID=UPI0027964EDE|nr:hypothetical protein [Massilia sp. CCM 9206]MDQ1921666.1 hypothetical protein [Massilia sp. CCM 9206]